jgi:hypothetical protein
VGNDVFFLFVNFTLRAAKRVKATLRADTHMHVFDILYVAFLLRSTFLHLFDGFVSTRIIVTANVLQEKAFKWILNLGM